MSKRSTAMRQSTTRRKGASLLLIPKLTPEGEPQMYEALCVWPDHYWRREVEPWVCANCGLMLEKGWDPGQCARRFYVKEFEIQEVGLGDTK